MDKQAELGLNTASVGGKCAKPTSRGLCKGYSISDKPVQQMLFNVMYHEKSGEEESMFV